MDLSRSFEFPHALTSKVDMSSLALPDLHSLAKQKHHFAHWRPPNSPTSNAVKIVDGNKLAVEIWVCWLVEKVASSWGTCIHHLKRTVMDEGISRQVWMWCWLNRKSEKINTCREKSQNYCVLSFVVFLVFPWSILSAVMWFLACLSTFMKEILQIFTPFLTGIAHDFEVSPVPLKTRISPSPVTVVRNHSDSKTKPDLVHGDNQTKPYQVRRLLYFLWKSWCLTKRGIFSALVWGSQWLGFQALK